MLKKVLKNFFQPKLFTLEEAQLHLENTQWYPAAVTAEKAMFYKNNTTICIKKINKNNYRVTIQTSAESKFADFIPYTFSEFLIVVKATLINTNRI